MADKIETYIGEITCLSLFGKRVLIEAMESLVKEEELSVERIEKRMQHPPAWYGGTIPEHIKEFNRLNKSVRERHIHDYKLLLSEIKRARECD